MFLLFKFEHQLLCFILDCTQTVEPFLCLLLVDKLFEFLLEHLDYGCLLVLLDYVLDFLDCLSVDPIPHHLYLLFLRHFIVLFPVFLSVCVSGPHWKFLKRAEPVSGGVHEHRVLVNPLKLLQFLLPHPHVLLIHHLLVIYDWLSKSYTFLQAIFYLLG